MIPIEDSKLGFTGASAGCTQIKQMGVASGSAPRPRQLHSRDELMALLNLKEEQVQFLINTRQITRIRIAGEERFDSRDVDGLIDSYKATAERNAQ